MKFGGPKMLAVGISLIPLVVGARVAAAPIDDEPTISDTAGAPYPGDESGRVDDTDDQTSVSRTLGRMVLLLPRLVVAAVFGPVRLGVWAFDRYQLGERYKRIFFNHAETYGLLPVARLDSGFGVNAGAKVFHRDLFGGGERFSAQASAGGRFKQRYVAAFQTGGLFDREQRPRVALELGGHFEDRLRDPFYGIGNDAPGLESRYRKRQMRASGAFGLRVAGDFYIRTAGMLSDNEFAGSNLGGPPIDMVYDTSTLPGYEDGVRDVYGELELRYDSRRHAKWEPPSAPSTGWLASVFAGRDHQFGMAGDYWRYGADLQRYIRLGIGPRTLIARVRGEAVNGSPDVPFSELPMLGGSALLRGYPNDRFRDRVTTLGSLEYQWDLNRFLGASLFVDAGRVFPALEDLRNIAGVDGLKVGYGVGVQFHTNRSFIARAHVATSIDGGLMVNMSFDPVFEPRPREGQ